jgi:LPS sulfotransferase NodH
VELPAVSYLVCASQRSGTELLCRCLDLTERTYRQGR